MTKKKQQLLKNLPDNIEDALDSIKADGAGKDIRLFFFLKVERKAGGTFFFSSLNKKNKYLLSQVNGGTVRGQPLCRIGSVREAFTAVFFAYGLPFPCGAKSNSY